MIPALFPRRLTQIGFLGLSCVIVGLFLLWHLPATWAYGGGGGGGFGGGVHFSGSYGGYHGVFHSSGGKGDSDWRIVVAILVVLFILLTLAVIFSPRQQFVHAIFVLPKPDYYLPAFADIASTAKFTTSSGRRDVLRRLVDLIEPNALVDGHITARTRYNQVVEIAGRMEALWREQMKVADVAPTLINIETPGRSVRYDNTKTASQSPVDKDAICVLNVIMVGSSRIRWQEGGVDEVRRSLQLIASFPPNFIYFFYTPEPDETILRAQAAGIIEKIKETVPVPPSDGATL